MNIEHYEGLLRNDTEHVIMAETASLPLEEMKPRLVPNAQFVPFKPRTEFLKNPDANTYLKLSKEEADLARCFSGEQTLADILRGQLEKSGTGTFQQVLSLLIRLRTHGFLASEISAGIADALKVSVHENPLTRLARRMAATLSFDWMHFRAQFSQPLLRTLAGIVASFPGLVLLSFLAAGNMFSAGVHRGIDITGPAKGILSDATGLGFGAYFLWLGGYWVCLCVILSLKNLFTAYALTANKCTVVNPRLRFSYGLIYFDCDPTDIVTRGEYGVLRVYGARILLPLAMLTLLSVGSRYGLNAPILSLLKEALLLVGVFSICPLVKTDMNNALHLLTNSTGDFGHTITYLRKKYFSSLHSHRALAGKGLDYAGIIVVLSATWLAGFYGVFYEFVSSAFEHVLDEWLMGFSWGSLLILTRILLITTPLLVLLLMTILIAVSSVRVVLQIPTRRILSIAESISMQKNPDEELAAKFLAEIPLFSHLGSKDLRRLGLLMKSTIVGPQRVIIMQGERGDSFYVVVSGNFGVELEDDFGQTRVIDNLSTGDSFGEIALIENVPRTATVVARTPARLFVLDRHHFNEFVKERTGDRENITDLIRTGKLLAASPLFCHLPPSQIRTLVGRFKTHAFESRETVFSQGDQGDRIYLIKAGKVEVKRTEKGNVVFSRTLGPGEWLGEIALVKLTTRTASAVCAARATILSLTKEDFYETMQNSLMTGMEFDQLAEGRLAEMAGKTT